MNTRFIINLPLFVHVRDDAYMLEMTRLTDLLILINEHNVSLRYCKPDHENLVSKELISVNFPPQRDYEAYLLLRW